MTETGVRRRDTVTRGTVARGTVTRGTVTQSMAARRTGGWRALAGMLAACLAATSLAVVTMAGSAAAAPGDTDDEGGTAALRDQLNAASKGFVEARTRLANSVKRQRQLNARLTRVERDLVRRTEAVAVIAGVAYRGGRAGVVSALLDSGSPDALLDRVAALDAVAANENAQIRALQRSRAEVTKARTAIAKEIAEQRKQVAIMAARKKQAENALAAAGRDGGPAAGPGGGSGGGGGRARPAPRNPDGSFPSESCRIEDPTTDGCITPRMLHALNQARAAGFTRFCSCFRGGGSGEHPQGRACDFSASRNGFGGVATGGDRTYGNNLANYFVRNADRLGVLYVIWFRQIWLPSSGWRSYSGAGGDPASDHTNHAHLSVI